jgi:ATP-dependent exoDNAse (exonuclease V) beta subunit
MGLNKFTIQKSFAINAGAGSGKTYTLSRRYINAILGFDLFREKGFEKSYYHSLKPATPKQIVTITYTEAAALEMKERIFGLMLKILNLDSLESSDGDKSSIEDALGSLEPTQKEYVITTLKRAITQSGEAKISTIHSYCLDILKTNADIARFDASIDIIKDDEKNTLIQESIFEVLDKQSNRADIEQISNYLNLYFLNTIFRSYATSTTFREAFDLFDRGSLTQTTLQDLILDLYPLPELIDDMDIVISKFQSEGLESKYIDFITSYIDNFSSFKAKNWSELSKEFEVAIAFNRKPFTSMKDIKDNIDAIKTLDKFVSIYSPIDTTKEALFYTKIDLLKSLMRQIKSLYDTKLKSISKLDFDEIITTTHNIMPKVNLDIKYMMVDEFQDTNSVQYDIIKNSLGQNSNLFVVGDSKQSIYSFQGAEIEVFNDAIGDKSYISSIEPMNINYRSDGVVLNRVNKIFKKILVSNSDITSIKQNYEASAQALKVSKPSKETQGSFEFLLNIHSKENESSEYENIAKLISSIKDGKLSQYQHITKLLSEKKQAIAVVFDSSSKMLELKSYLKAHQIDCKVSASENFYHTKEVNDIFNLLMTIHTPKDKFYKAAALRSNILRYDDNTIANIISNDLECKELEGLKERFKSMLLSQFIEYIYQKYSLLEVQSYFENSDQRVANLEKFLLKAIEYENSNGNDSYGFVKQIERNIYFSDTKEDEAFFKSDNLESIQLCTIHSTKGLAYPMVIVANSDKNLYTQIQSDSIKTNSFTILPSNDRKLIAGFKVDGYEPLSFRVLKQIDKLKHLAEKKRLLYVALTRAKNDVVISGTIKKSISETSYLGMIMEGLKLELKDISNILDKLDI